MGSSMRIFVPLVFLVLASIVEMGTEGAVPPCDMVYGNLYPCGLYISQEGTFLENCCEGLRELKEEAKTPSDRISLCYCAKSYLSEVPPSQIKIYAALPGVCNVTLGYTLELITDCNNRP